MEPLLITIDNAADILAVSSRTVRRMLERGELPSVRIGRSIRIPYESLKSWITQSTRQLMPPTSAHQVYRGGSGTKTQPGQPTTSTNAAKELDALLASKK